MFDRENIIRGISKFYNLNIKLVYVQLQQMYKIKLKKPPKIYLIKQRLFKLPSFDGWYTETLYTSFERTDNWLLWRFILRGAAVV